MGQGAEAAHMACPVGSEGNLKQKETSNIPGMSATKRSGSLRENDVARAQARSPLILRQGRASHYTPT